MLTSKTPYRMSFFGGGSDYPDWYLKEGGLVVGTTIDKYCYVNLRKLPPFFEHKHRVVYSEIELPSCIADIKHPAVRAVLQDQGVDYGIEMIHAGDLPARSGLGSSSTFTVGLLNTLYALENKAVTPMKLAMEAIRIEQDVSRENVGSQDQTWAAFGGTNVIRFKKDGSISVDPIIMPGQRHRKLESKIMLFFTGTTRLADTIAKKKIQNLSVKKCHVKRIMQYAEDAIEILQDPNHSLDNIGDLLHQNWLLKRELADSVSNSNLDQIYERALHVGANGGKLLGAGGGGFFMFYVPEEKQEAVKRELSELIHVNVRIGSPGSKIINYETEDRSLFW